MSYVINGILGLVVGDAVGVPVEFQSRKTLKKNPVTNMREFGTHHQQRGTWSDDSSMTFCTMDSLCGGYDLKDMMEKFCQWLYEGEYTPWGSVFDAGIATRGALRKYKDGVEVLECGGRELYDNGNGSLMRILPVVFYQYEHCQHFVYCDRPGLVNPIHEVSALTHAHPISMIGCGIYAQLAAALISRRESDEMPEHEKILDILQNAVAQAWNDYENGIGNLYDDSEYGDALNQYGRLRDIKKFQNLPESSIKSSGYVVSTLEAALWCLLNTDNYRDCVLKAVNLGEDTDTVAAVAGSLAGILYGCESIPKEWIESIARLDWIMELCRKFEDVCNQ